MIFAVIGLFKSPHDDHNQALAGAVNEHMAQPFQRVISAGFLHDDQNRKIGVLSLLEAQSHEKAQAYVDSGPFKQQDLYERLMVTEYASEVGRLG